MHIMYILGMLPLAPVRRHLRRMMEGEGEEGRAQPYVARLADEEREQ